MFFSCQKLKTSRKCFRKQTLPKSRHLFFFGVGAVIGCSLEEVCRNMKGVRFSQAKQKPIWGWVLFFDIKLKSSIFKIGRYKNFCQDYSLKRTLSATLQTIIGQYRPQTHN